MDWTGGKSIQATTENESATASALFVDLLDSLIVDVASEAHRSARLGLDHRLNMDEEEELRLSAQARNMLGETGTSCPDHGEAGAKHYGIDVFGQKHPAVASDIFDCMNCGRPITAGRFAPHLEKCMGKGRRARYKSNGNVQQQQQQQQSQRKLRASRLESQRSIAEKALEEEEDD